MMKTLRNLLKDEGGQGMTEYALIIGLVALMLIGAIVLFRDKLADIFNGITGELTDHATPPTSPS